MSKATRWSSFEDEILLTGLREKRPLRDIASRLGRREIAVTERALALGLADALPPPQPYEAYPLAA